MKTLPHHHAVPCLTDGGLETTLIFHEGIELPEFAAFVLLDTPEGRNHLRRYFRTYGRLARSHGVGLVLESPTWRSNPDWGRKLGYDDAALDRINREAIGLIREEFEGPALPVHVSGCVGPRGDGYLPSAVMSAPEAAAYHARQIRVMRDAGADFVSAITMNTIGEALGIATAAADLGIPSVISFTLETDGRLATGDTLASAIETVDRSAPVAPAYYMINCAHPSHFAGALPPGAPWLDRIRGVRANASCRSHAELNESPDLDAGDPVDLGARYRDLRRNLTRLAVLGGCCGTDHRHVDAIFRACAPERHAA